MATTPANTPSRRAESPAIARTSTSTIATAISTETRRRRSRSRRRRCSSVPPLSYLRSRDTAAAMSSFLNGCGCLDDVHAPCSLDSCIQTLPSRSSPVKSSVKSGHVRIRLSLDHRSTTAMASGMSDDSPFHSLDSRSRYNIGAPIMAPDSVVVDPPPHGGMIWTKECFPLVIYSWFPCMDVYESMLELAIAKGLSHLDELEDMFACFMLLNSPKQHHIVQEAYKALLTHLYKAKILLDSDGSSFGKDSSIQR